MKRFFISCIFLFSLIFSFPLYSQGYPNITSLTHRNILFKQYQEEVEASNMAYAARQELPLNFYTYTANESDSIIAIASRCSLRFDTLASLNGIAESTASLAGVTLVLPVSNGVYLPETAVNSVELLLKRQFASYLASFEDSSEEENLSLKWKKPLTCFVDGKKYIFIPDGKFSPEVRAFFLNTAMHLPLSDSVLTSEFGMRVSPISGKWRMHNGIDLAAPLGTEVFSCKSGTVSEVVELDPVYGNCVMIRHEGGMVSLYAHLKDVLVKKGDVVPGGKVIAHVGLTGLTTGPHLHFEIRANGMAQNPHEYF